LLWSARSRRLRLKRWRSRRRGRRQRAADGFTLIEALAAIVVLALSLSVLLPAYSNGLRGAGSIDEHFRARLLAQSLLADWTRHRVVQEPARGRSGRFTWTVSATPFAGAGTAAQDPEDWVLHELTVTVAWPPARQVRLDTLQLMRVR
jgi:type II secretory pathway pseudopilin PulG